MPWQARGKATEAAAEPKWPTWEHVEQQAQKTRDKGFPTSFPLARASAKQRARALDAIDSFTGSATVQDEARAIYINAKVRHGPVGSWLLCSVHAADSCVSQLFPEAAAAFKEELQAGMTSPLITCLQTHSTGASEGSLNDHIFELFAAFALKTYQNHEVFKTYRHAAGCRTRVLCWCWMQLICYPHVQEAGQHCGPH